MNLPIILTLTRLMGSLTVVPLFLFYVMPFSDFFWSKILALVVLLFGLTDFLDGYYARKYNQVSSFGQVLDPIADKCFVLSVFIVFVKLNLLNFYIAFLLIARELIITGLRAAATQQNFVIKVSSLGKWKATIQYCYMFFMVSKPWAINNNFILFFEYALLIAMTGLSFISAFFYCFAFIKEQQKQTLSNFQR